MKSAKIFQSVRRGRCSLVGGQVAYAPDCYRAHSLWHFVGFCSMQMVLVGVLE